MKKLSNCWLTPGQLILRNFGSKPRIILILIRTYGSALPATSRRYFNALRSNEKHKPVKNAENYLFVTMKNMFEYWYNDVNAQRANQ